MNQEVVQAIAGIKVPILMGILNVTPDSFSDGGEYSSVDAAVTHAEALIQEGAGIIDIGGESTRPGSDYVSSLEETARVIPVLQQICNNHPNTVISIDTRKSEVARLGIESGARYINDISALRDDPDMAQLLANHPSVQVILMHMLGNPKHMQSNPCYNDLIPQILEFFEERIRFCVSQGIQRDRLLLDPGIGFGKTAEHNVELLTNIDKLRVFGLPLVLGASRKRFISAFYPSDVKDRIGGSLATALILAMQNVDILRVHDVREHAQFFAILKKLVTGDIS